MLHLMPHLSTATLNSSLTNTNNRYVYIIYTNVYILLLLLLLLYYFISLPTVPPIPVSLSPTSYEVPNFHPYNSISFNCSITIPTGHAITSYFNWYRDNQMLLHGQDRISIVVKDHSSSLSFEATSAGMAKYRCSVILGFPSPDPNVTLSANSTVNVIGKESWLFVALVRIVCIEMFL